MRRRDSTRGKPQRRVCFRFLCRSAMAALQSWYIVMDARAFARSDDDVHTLSCGFASCALWDSVVATRRPATPTAVSTVGRVASTDRDQSTVHSHNGFSDSLFLCYLASS